MLLTKRTADLTHYPQQRVFPGGATDTSDEGPVAAALRKAAEEVGLDPDTVHILGTLPALGLPDSGFLVTLVIGWTNDPRVPYGAIRPKSARSTTSSPATWSPTLASCMNIDDHAGSPTGSVLSLLGRMTADVLNLLPPSLAVTTPSTT